jgi:hypothetical protein
MQSLEAKEDPQFVKEAKILINSLNNILVRAKSFPQPQPQP